MHKAAMMGSHELTETMLRKGTLDMDKGDPQGVTPLMIAAQRGYSRVARILLEKGANVSVKADRDFTALHCCCQGGHVEVVKLLVEAGGSDLEARDRSSCTPLFVAATRGHWQIVRVLIEAGANPNASQSCGSTPLFNAAYSGHLAAVRVLILGNADPRLGKKTSPLETSRPVDVAAQNGHSEVVRELIQRFGIDGCCSPADRGQRALAMAAGRNHVDAMEHLTAAGVVDAAGAALLEAAEYGREASVKYLVQQHQQTARGGHWPGGYVNIRNRNGATPLSLCVRYTRVSARIVRLLLDAGADAASFIDLREPVADGGLMFTGTPLALATTVQRSERFHHEGVTEEQLNKLEAARRLLMRVEAVHAVSWLWPRDAAPVAHHAAGGASTTSSPTGTALKMTLPVLRRRARRPRLLLAPMFRWVGDARGVRPTCIECTRSLCFGFTFAWLACVTSAV